MTSMIIRKAGRSINNVLVRFGYHITPIASINYYKEKYISAHGIAGRL
jgi:hypothetical protein